MKLRTRFAVMALVLAEGSLLGSLVLQQTLENRHLERKQARHQRESLGRLARVAQDASLEGNELFLVNYLRVLSQLPEIGYAAALDGEGKIRMHTGVFNGQELLHQDWAGPRHQGKTAEPQVQAVMSDGSRLQDWSLPIVRGSPQGPGSRAQGLGSRAQGLGSRVAGEVHIGFDVDILRKQVRSDLLESGLRLAGVALAASLLVLAAAAWLARQLEEPISALHEGARRLGSGEFAYRIPATGDDEFGDLARTFNGMASELDRMDKFKEQLMACIAHDLRTPLLAVRGHAELLLNDPESSAEEQRESAQIIYENARRMAAMTEDLTDLAKLQMGRLEVKRLPIEVGSSVEAVRKLLAVTAERLKIRLNSELPPDLPTVLADQAQLERVLTNLVANALKFTPADGEVRLSAATRPHHVHLTVSDTGMGIPAQKLKGLFSRFHPYDGIGSGKPGPVTGLGLSICRELVDAHGGKIWAESEWSHGAKIHFTLPLMESPCSADC